MLVKLIEWIKAQLRLTWKIECYKKENNKTKKLSFSTETKAADAVHETGVNQSCCIINKLNFKTVNKKVIRRQNILIIYKSTKL